MDNDNNIPFLCSRLKELRETNNCTMEEMARKIDELEGLTSSGGMNKSSISRVEAGKTTEKTLKEMARKYCNVFEMTASQTEQFLRGEKIVIPDTSALLRNIQLIDQLNKQYSKVIIPKIVIDELDYIKNNYGNIYKEKTVKSAWEILRGISYGDRTISKEYNGDKNEINDFKIISIARDASKEYHCHVDIITEDTDYSAYLKGDEFVKALSLMEYIVTYQGIINMNLYNTVKEYYADSYEDIKTLEKEEINAYDNEGFTLLISCVRNRKVPIEQRKEKIRWLIKNGADINRRDCSKHYLPALSHAIQINDYDMFEFLLDECGANPNISSRNPHGYGKVRQKNEGNMPLMIAAWSGKVKFVKKLCEHKDISINQQDANGFTALIKACANGYINCRDILIEAGADTKIIDMNGKNYIDFYNRYLEIGPLAKRGSNGNNKNIKGKRGSKNDH